MLWFANSQKVMANSADSLRKNHKNEWEIFLPLWIPKAAVNIETQGIPPINQLPEDLPDDGDNLFDKLFTKMSNVDYFFTSGLKFQKKDFYGELIFMGGKINNSAKFVLSSGELLKTDLGATVTDVKIGYVFFDKHYDKKLLKGLNSSINLGIRYNYIFIKMGILDYNDLVSINPGWFHLLGGIKFEYIISEKFKMILEADYGGNVINSNNTYSVFPKIQYNFKKRWYLRGGYKFYNFNGEKEIGGENYKVGLKMNGPTLGFGVHF